MYNFDIDIEAILNQLNQQPERTRTGNHHRSTVVGESPFPSPWRWLQVMAPFSGTDLLELPTIYEAYISGLNFREYS